MKFKLQGRTYEAAAIDRLTLGDLMRLENETELMGRPMKWSELRGILDHFADLIQTAQTDEEVMDDDRWPWFMGILIWATRRNAGDVVTFGEAVEIPLGEIEMIDDDKVKKPQDRKPKKAPGGAADPRRARAASARAAAREAAPALTSVSQ